MNKIFKIVLCLTLVLNLTACLYSEPDAKFTVTAIGFSGKNGMVCAYLQTIDFASVQNGGSETFLTKGEGEDVLSALNNVKTKLSKAPSFEHCQIILLSGGIEGQLLPETLAVCEELGMSQRVRIVYTENIQSLLQNSKLSGGSEIESLVKRNADSWGFGKHTALFEIKTAILVNDGNFAIVNIETKNKEVKFSGLAEYKNGKRIRLLNLEQSSKYSKENLR